MARPALNAPPQTSTAEALVRLPSAPREFTAEQRREWKRIGKPLVDARMLTAADLVMLAESARVSARLTALYADSNVKPSTLVAWARLFKESLNALGASPASRKAVSPTAAPATDSGLKALIDG